MSEYYGDEYTKDNRRNSKKEAAVNHFKGGKKMARRHKDTVQEKDKTVIEEAEVSRLGFKVRQALKDETFKLIKDENIDGVAINKIFGNKYIRETICYKQKDEIEIEPEDLELIHEDGPIIKNLCDDEDMISFIWNLSKNEKSKWVFLNHPNPLSPCAGFDKSASSYEEALIFSSGLYRSLMEGEGKDMYIKNQKLDEKKQDGVYRADLIYCPNIPVFRDNEMNLVEDYEKESTTVNVISIPAINYKIYSNDDDFSFEKYEKNMRSRINRILKVALKHGHTKIFISPWGCGIEQGPWEDVLEWFKEDEFFDFFEEVNFLQF
jgi:uncharacterized protein (TIGR02452 family)